MLTTPHALTPLQTWVFPSTEVWADESMYFRGYPAERLLCPLGSHHLVIQPHTTLASDTFYNSLSIGVWKRYCDVSSIVFWLRGQGHFFIRFGVHRQGVAHRWLLEQEVVLSENTEVVLNLPFWAQLHDGMLHAQIRALAPTQITAAGYATADSAQHAIKLGIVITHFNRQAYVVPAIERTRRELLNDPSYQGKITLTVVDNSQNIGITESAGLSIIANKNLGGSGGFTRGLLSLEDQGTYTHCLFMDDDASCEVESIRRAYALLAFSKTPKLAVAGSLLRELEPYHLFEKGANFDGLCRPLHGGLDMRKVEDLLQAETNHSLTSYGAWWFFAFPLKHITHYPFPFFVRGDDILFSLQNDFSISTMNGIACFGDDFSLKSSPLTIYLDLRSLLVHLMAEQTGAFKALSLIARFFLGTALSYHYETAQAVLLAIEHISDGGKVFEHDRDLSKTRALIGSYVRAEKLQPMPMPAEMKVESRAITTESRWKTCLRWLTANGFLIPFAIRNATVLQPKGFRGKLREIYGYRRVMYRYSPLGLGYILEYDCRRFWRLTGRFLIQATRFTWRYTAIKRTLNSRVAQLSERQAWSDLYR